MQPWNVRCSLRVPMQNYKANGDLPISRPTFLAIQRQFGSAAARTVIMFSIVTEDKCEPVSRSASVFRELEKTLVNVGSLSIPHAHTVGVDPETHLVYFLPSTYPNPSGNKKMDHWKA